MEALKRNLQTGMELLRDIFDELERLTNPNNPDILRRYIADADSLQAEHDKLTKEISGAGILKAIWVHNETLKFKNRAAELQENVKMYCDEERRLALRIANGAVFQPSSHAAPLDTASATDYCR
ncbi:hypothetical protein PUNSTDRAFT_145665 [Punctularia strigosozonata HHB-11173 SS5]|uniref:uncharacterized protein n=1 Tax=Punctularia strigosozonata (strain HHB-11173) TaxID=741275 RepID=UPI00044179B3|nr:uncharacterized protein PUNSTDRAFT_145665 [Punctularia strigosozonata HHB-11173 SS5]EIN05717.1 hypothetical protein PUNSTDRAFT_145665 [Punctularia strigosozonata HHB-11173 SS5]